MTLDELLVPVVVILLAAYLGAHIIRSARVVRDCVGLDILDPPADFDRWQAELDYDDTEPALAVPTPVSDEHLLDVWNTTRDPGVAR